MSARPPLPVTGLSGRIGVVLRATAGDAWNLVNLDLAEGVDLTDRAQIETALAPCADARALIHLAAWTDVSGAFAQTDDREGVCWRTNVVGTRNVAEACAAHGLHLIHVSTDFVFDGERDTPYDESCAPHPIEWYGRTKCEAERVVRDSDAAWTIVRIAFPYGTNGETDGDWVARLRARLARGETAPLFTDQIVTPTFAGDIAEGLALLAHTRPEGETFHLTGSTSLSPFDLGRAVAEAFGFDADLIQPSSRVEYLKRDPRPRQRCLRMDNARWSAYAARHGLARPLGVTEGLAAMRAREKNHHW